MEKIRGLLLIFLFSMLTAFDYDFTNAPTGEEYITGEDGIKRIYKHKNLIGEWIFESMTTIKKSKRKEITILYKDRKNNNDN